MHSLNISLQCLVLKLRFESGWHRRSRLLTPLRLLPAISAGLFWAGPDTQDPVSLLRPVRRGCGGQRERTALVQAATNPHPAPSLGEGGILSPGAADSPLVWLFLKGRQQW